MAIRTTRITVLAIPDIPIIMAILVILTTGIHHCRLASDSAAAVLLEVSGMALSDTSAAPLDTPVLLEAVVISVVDISAAAIRGAAISVVAIAIDRASVSGRTRKLCS